MLAVFGVLKESQEKLALLYKDVGEGNVYLLVEQVFRTLSLKVRVDLLLDECNDSLHKLLV